MKRTTPHAALLCPLAVIALFASPLSALPASAQEVTTQSPVTTAVSSPDVPADHWAYVALDKLKKAGIVDETPDTIQGNIPRLLTRNQFATTIGQVTSQITTIGFGNIERREMITRFARREEAETLRRLVNEFRTELGQLGQNSETLDEKMKAVDRRVVAIENESGSRRVGPEINLMTQGVTRLKRLSLPNMFTGVRFGMWIGDILTVKPELKPEAFHELPGGGVDKSRVSQTLYETRPTGSSYSFAMYPFVNGKLTGVISMTDLSGKESSTIRRNVLKDILKTYGPPHEINLTKRDAKNGPAIVPIAQWHLPEGEIYAFYPLPASIKTSAPYPVLELFVLNQSHKRPPTKDTGLKTKEKEQFLQKVHQEIKDLQ